MLVRLLQLSMFRSMRSTSWTESVTYNLRQSATLSRRGLRHNQVQLLSQTRLWQQDRPRTGLASPPAAPSQHAFTSPDSYSEQPWQQAQHPEQPGAASLYPPAAADPAAQHFGGIPDQPAAPLQQQPEGAGQEGVVPPPRIVAWSPALVNNVKLLGLVGQSPVVKYLPNGSVKAELRLGVRHPAKEGSVPASSWVHVEAWDTQAQQVAQYVRKGMRLAVSGRFQEDAWVDRATGAQREMLKVVARTVAIVDDERARAASQAEKPASSREPAAPRARYTPSAIAKSCYEMYHDGGRCIAEVAAATNRKHNTVLDYIVTCVMAGAPVEVARLAAELQMGPAGSEFLAAGEIDAAIEQNVANVMQEPGVTSPPEMQTLRLKPIYELLGATPQTAAKVQRQQQRGLGASLTYHQIVFVLAMKRYGYDWDTLIMADPPPQFLMPHSTAPAGMQPGPGPQQMQSNSLPF